MNRQEANKQILDMYNDSTYQELKSYYDKTTIFNVLSYEYEQMDTSVFVSCIRLLPTVLAGCPEGCRSTYGRLQGKFVSEGG